MPDYEMAATVTVMDCPDCGSQLGLYSCPRCGWVDWEAAYAEADHHQELFSRQGVL